MARRVRFGAAVCGIIGSVAGHAADPIGDALCRQAALDRLADWASTGEFLLASDSTDEVRVFHSPTETLGTWVVVTIDSGRVERLLRVSPDAETTVRLDQHCNLSTNLRHRDPQDDGRPSLTDADVARIIGSGDGGVFYAWSPHMPLSVEGYREIRAAANRLGLAMTPVLSSHSNVDYAEDRARRVGIPRDAFALNRSIELTMRDLNVHAPAILIYANGAFVSPVIPGFRRAADYESLILRFLGE